MATIMDETKHFLGKVCEIHFNNGDKPVGAKIKRFEMYGVHLDNKSKRWYPYQAIKSIELLVKKDEK